MVAKTRPSRRLRTRLSIAWIVCLGLSPWISTAQEATSEVSESATTVTSTDEEKPDPTTLTDIPDELIEFEQKSRELRQQLGDREKLDRLKNSLDNFEGQLQSVFEASRSKSVAEASMLEMMDLTGKVLVIETPLSAATQTLESMSRKLETDLADLETRETRWDVLGTAASTLRAPAEITEQVRKTKTEITELTATTLARRDEVLSLLSRATSMNVELADFRAQVAETQRKKRRRTLLAEDLPLWKLTWRQSDESVVRSVASQWKAEMGHLGSYLKVNAPRALSVFFGSLVLILVFLRRLRLPAQKRADEDPDAALALEVIDPAWPIALILSSLLTVWLAPPAPVAFYETLFFLIPLPAAIFVLKTWDRSVRISVIAIAIALALLTLRSYTQHSPLLDRLVLIGQCVGVGAALAWDLRRGNWSTAFAGKWHRLPSRVLQISAGVLFATALLAIFGQLGLARNLRSGVLGTLGFGLVFSGLYRAIDSLVKTWVRTPSAISLAMIRNHPKTMYLYFRRTLGAATLGSWVVASIYSFDVQAEAKQQLISLLQSGIKIREFDITIGAIITFALIVASSFLIAKIVCLILEEEFLPRLDLGRGLPYAISTVSRYIILVVGFTVAMAAAGVDLSKATLLAGAFGVGIGFGLQNVVNNFVSGLILLFERPVQVGDAIEVGGLVGEVTAIGIRASTVRTYQGAEVIVPNGELISTQVINWTFSNRRRRVEIPLGVAYGSDPEKVIQLLLDTAKGHDRVQSDPEPSVLFTGFGDSSLDFIVRCWVNTFEEGVNVGSELRIQIERALRDAGIEIPYPQRDIHIRSESVERPESPDVTPDSSSAE